MALYSSILLRSSSSSDISAVGGRSRGGSKLGAQDPTLGGGLNTSGLDISEGRVHASGAGLYILGGLDRVCLIFQGPGLNQGTRLTPFSTRGVHRTHTLCTHIGSIALGFIVALGLPPLRVLVRYTDAGTTT